MVLLLAAYVPAVSAEEPLTGEQLKQELVLIRNNMRAISELADRLEGGSGESGLFQPPVEIADGPAGAESHRVWLNAVKADLFANFWSLNRLLSAPKPAADGKPVRTVNWKTGGKSGSREVKLPADADITNLEIAIHNRGNTPLVNPRLMVNGRGNWYSTPDILAEILTDGMSDFEKSEAIWRFIRDNRYHYEPPHGRAENHDPVKFLNVYGYGFCDDSSTNFAALARAAGLKARVWGLSGHVVPEVWYDGGWHMFDPDGLAYYRYPDKNTVASIADIVAHPEILSQPEKQAYGIEMLTRVYTTTENNSLHDWYLESISTEHKMSVTLRPGESLIRSWGNRGLYYCGYRYDEPPEYGNGKIVFRPVLTGDGFRTGAAEVRNLKSVEGGIGPSGENGTSVLTYRFRSPYPFLAGRVGIKYAVEKPGDKISVVVAKGDGWIEVGRLETADRGEAGVWFGLDGCFVNGYGDPTYDATIKLVISRSGGGSETILMGIEYDLDLQCAPLSLPALKPGANRVEFRSDSPEAEGVEVEHRFCVEAGG
jgi:hypothetical protein